MSNKLIVIGAGPYGLSLAAHLHARGVGFRIFGEPMANWQHRMPRGMLLKSEGFASNLAAPADSFTLADFCARGGLPYAAEGLPVPREIFIDYGKAFQQRYVPEVEERRVVSLRRSGDNFSARLDDGEIVTAEKVVVAVGISDFAHMPACFADLPAEFVTHASSHEDMAAFAGRSVAVIGGGSSATDIAALLHEAGAAVQLITRRGRLPFHSPPAPHRSLLDRLRSPMTGIGPGWRSTFYTRSPQLFFSLPADLRMRIVGSWLGPAGGWYMRDRLVGRVACLEGYAPQAADVAGGRVRLRLVRADGSQRVVAADHVISATGYKVDIDRVGFIDPELRRAVAAVSGWPVLSRDFESSVPGLFLVGPAAAYSFGPMFRFVFGARYAARRLARRLAAASLRLPSPQRPALAAR
ncbi:MAG TPA: NAD(P)-binding domain-containing protein [Stellaceae bacterium]|nr:NAD(P)-binding domain-containing protein [Stellaceae bacterium]